MIQILKYSQMKDVADAVQACIDHGGMSLWSALVDVMDEVEGISVEPDCRYTQCDHGMGLAEKGNCPAGNPADRECAEFKLSIARSQRVTWSEKPEGDMEREGWAALNDRGCPFTINLHAHYFRKKKSLCEKYAIVDDANLVESYSDVNYCPVCDLRVKQRTHEIDSHAQDVAKKRWKQLSGSSDIFITPVSDELMIPMTKATPEQIRVMVHAPEMLEYLEMEAVGGMTVAETRKLRTALIKKARGE